MNIKKALAHLYCGLIWNQAKRRAVREVLLHGHELSGEVTGRTKFEIVKARLLTRMDMLASRLHPETFGKYKNAFAGKDVVLLATGPTLEKFTPIKDAIYVGVNRAFQYDKVKLDYLFMGDYAAVSSYIEEAADYPATKFYGIVEWRYFHHKQEVVVMTIPESIALRHKALRFYENGCTDTRIGEDLDFVVDIACQPLTVYASSVFYAMQFILYGNPRRVYLVGCDVSKAGHFGEKKGNEIQINDWGINTLIRGWHKMKEFVKTYYPETEIVSINPVGLKGMFKDKYQ